MLIGIPKELAQEEKRIALSPAGVDALARAGHTVYIESKAGEGSNFSDKDFEDVGAKIVFSAEEVFCRSNLLAKVAPLQENELEMLQQNQILFSFLHLVVSKRRTIEELLSKKITAIGYELIEQNNNLTILNSMSEIAGQLAIQVAERYLENFEGKGRGILLGGLTGVAPASVVILGAGVVGTIAARSAIGRGAQVIVLDNNLNNLRKIELLFDKKITTVVANPYTISRGVKFADVLIGAVLIKGDKTPNIVTEEMVKTMKPGSVIIDVSIDQGGCIETSRVTSLSNPIYEKHGVIHYCVPNIPSLVSRTASYALNNSSIQYILNIANNGLENILMDDHGFSKGICTYNGNCSSEILSKIFNLDYRPLRIFSKN